MPKFEEIVDIDAELNELKSLLNSENLEAISERFERIKKGYSLDNKAQLAGLTQFVQEYVRDAAPSWSESVLQQFFRGVARWSIPSATQALEPLLQRLPSAQWCFQDWCLYTSIFAQGSFSPAAQERWITPLLAGFESSKFAETLRSGDYDMRAAAQLLHGLAILDANKPNPMFARMAEAMFTSAKPKLHTANYPQTSAMYHAFCYFKNRYPQSPVWSQEILEVYFGNYIRDLTHPSTVSASLASKTQQEIHTSLSTLYPKVEQGVYHKNAGILVDAVAGGVNVLLSSDSLPADRLALKTLQQTGPAVLITRDAWRACSRDKSPAEAKKAQLDYLRSAIADAPRVERPFFETSEAAETTATPAPEQKTAYTG